MPVYDTVIFDLDGTLIDSMPGVEYALLEAIRLVLPEAEKQLPQIREYIGPTLNELIKQLLPEVSPELTDKIVHQFREIYDSIGWQKTTVYKEVINTLSRLIDQGIKCFLVTNKRLQPTLKILRGFGLSSFFYEVVSVDPNDMAFKSKVSVVRYLIEKHHFDPKKTLLVGDSIEDANTAQASGIDFAFAAYGYGNYRQFSGIRIVNFLNQPGDLCNIFTGAHVNE